MAPLIPQLTVVTAGKETTWGTGVTATYKMMDVIDAPQPDPGAKFVKIPTIRGGISSLAYITARASEMPPTSSWKHVATYQDICYHLESLTGVISPTGSGPYVRAGAAPLTGVVSAPRMQTIYTSNLDSTDGFFYKYTGCQASKIALSVKSMDYATLTVDRLASRVASADATTAATGTLTDRSVVPIMGNDMLLYLDDVGDTIGTTAIAPAGYEYNLEIDSGRKLDGQLGSPYGVQVIEGDWTGKLSMKLIWTASSKAYVDAMFGTATTFQKQVRAKFTTGSTAIAQFDFSGNAVKSAKINEGSNETVVVTIELEQLYNSTLGNWFKFSNTNSVATLV